MVSKISRMEFSMLSPEMIRSMARVRVVVAELYDIDGYPVEGGVMDPRLGVIDPGLYCRTCGGGMGDCHGHFGYLELAKPIIHVLYTKTIYQLLKITCRKCQRIMVEGKFDFTVTTITQPQKCPHCNAKQKKIVFVKPYTYYEDKKELSPTDIRELFENIPTSDLKRINFNGGRPEWLIITMLLIPPVTTRPSITLEGGERSEDDLTHKLVDVVRINQSLKENVDIGAPEFILNDLWELVQYHVSTYFDNELTGTPLARHRSGRALKGLVQRLKAKEGRIRGNLLGKRVNFSARTVITPDPRISIGDVGVPKAVAEELTIPVYVTKMSMNYVKDLLRKGKVDYVIRPDKRRVKVTEENKKDIISNIDVDWTADKQLENDDIVIFNRQPSLHRISIMAHRVKVMPYNTFRINPSVCPPYNADFDGDEMNLHALQSEEAMVEATNLMNVQNNIISPKFGGPIIGCTLDHISSIYILTKNGVVFTREQAAQLLDTAKIDMNLPDKKEFTGKELFSFLLPKNLNIEFESNFTKNLGISIEEKKKMDGWVSIKKGQIISGRIDKTAIGAESGKLISRVNRVAGSKAAKDFIDRCGDLGIAYIMKRGFSMGISDLDIPTHISKSVSEEVKHSEKESNLLIEDFEKGKLRILPGMTSKDSLEAQIMNSLANGVSKISDIISDNLKENDIRNMYESGAKGSIINTTQMIAVVGQETILGKRIDRGYFRRTLPHITPRDLSPGSHGFVSRGFRQGLSPLELFWNIMNGREGLMDKSLRTRKSGYMQRRLVNALQDMRVRSDMTVRDANNNVVQFVAGEDLIDPSKSDWGKIMWK